MSEVPESVQKLLGEREAARAANDFAKSDVLRQEIASLGYVVNDNPEGYNLMKQGDEGKAPEKHFLLLFGSGEIAPSSVSIYRDTFLAMGKRDIKIALITTPAGFQPNVDRVYGEIKDFLLASLPDFNLSIDIVYANTLADANRETVATAVDSADVIFTGPGSPTYAVKNLRDSLLLKHIIERVKNGSTLILASAATLAFSQFCLPVYEIYKVGEDLHWVDGLDVYDAVWQRATVIPHFNNAEGGEGLDTSYCFIGHARAAKLLASLPANTWALGIDEHTAYIVDLATGIGRTEGKGGVYEIDIHTAEPHTFE